MVSSRSLRCDVYDYFFGRGSCIIRSVGGFLLGGATNSCLRGCRDGSFLFIIMLLDVGPDGGKASRMKLFSGLAAHFLFLYLSFVPNYCKIQVGCQMEDWSPLPEATQLAQKVKI